MAIAFVQGVVDSTTSNTVSINGVSSGNLLVFSITYFINLGVAAVTAISDGVNTWVQAPSAKGSYTSSKNVMSDIWYAKNVTGGNLTLTITTPGDYFFLAKNVSEFSGADLTTPLVSATNLSSQTGHPVAPSLTSINSTDLLYVNITGDAGTNGVAAPWTLTNGYTVESAAYYLPGSITTSQASTTTGTSMQYCSSGAIFQAVTGPVVPHSIVLSAGTQLGQVADTSLSTGENNFSVSLWFKSTALIPITNVPNRLCGTFDDANGTGGWAFVIEKNLGQGQDNGFDGQIEWATINHSHNPGFVDPFNNGAAGLYGLISYHNNSIDGNWHHLCATYDGTYLHPQITSVTDENHLVLDDTTGILSGDILTQRWYSSYVVSVDSPTQLTITTHPPTPNNSDTWTAGYVYTGGLTMYLDGVAIRSYVDYEQPPQGADYTSTFHFAIGCIDQASGNQSRIGKYAYPALYASTLTPAQVQTLHIGGTVAGQQAVWNFTEGSGLTAADSSGNGHTLTFTSGISWDTDLPTFTSPSSIKKTCMFFGA